MASSPLSRLRCPTSTTTSPPMSRPLTRPTPVRQRDATAALLDLDSHDLLTAVTATAQLRIATHLGGTQPPGGPPDQSAYRSPRFLLPTDADELAAATARLAAVIDHRGDTIAAADVRTTARLLSDGLRTVAAMPDLSAKRTLELAPPQRSARRWPPSAPCAPPACRPSFHPATASAAPPTASPPPSTGYTPRRPHCPSPPTLRAGRRSSPRRSPGPGDPRTDRCPAPRRDQGCRPGTAARRRGTSPILTTAAAQTALRAARPALAAAAGMAVAATAGLDPATKVRRQAVRGRSELQPPWPPRHRRTTQQSHPLHQHPAKMSAAAPVDQPPRKAVQASRSQAAATDGATVDSHIDKHEQEWR